MLRWLDPRRVRGSAAGERDVDRVTDDPLAAIDPSRQGKQIYSVSRSVYLPRVILKNGDVGVSIPSKRGINPVYSEDHNCLSVKCAVLNQKLPTNLRRSSRQSTPISGGKSTSSGYGGSHGYSSQEPLYPENVRLREDAVSVLERNGDYVKSIKVAVPERTERKKGKVSPSHVSGSSGAGTLTTIPEGRIDFTIPRPIWPKFDRNRTDRKPGAYDSLVDEAVLLYTSSSYLPSSDKACNSDEQSIKDILVELLGNINDTIEGKGLTADEMLKFANEKIALSLEALKRSTEEEMRKLCVNMSNSKNVSSVVRAFSNSSGNSTSGNSSQSSPEWSSGRVRTLSETEDIYQIPSGSSSSGFSDSVKQFDISQLPVFVHEDLASVPNGVRNAMIYGTLCRTNLKTGTEKLVNKDKSAVQPKRSLLQAADGSKPSVWEQYYGVNVVPDGAPDNKYIPKPTDVPVFPGGRPEADFTLDVPRSEFLTKRMKDAKKWRCRCRLLTSFLGFVFFLLSVMAVSLLLTRGKRMFGSMV